MEEEEEEEEDDDDNDGDDDELFIMAEEEEECKWRCKRRKGNGWGEWMLYFLRVARHGAGGWFARGGGGRGRVAVVGFEVKMEQFYCCSSDRI